MTADLKIDVVSDIACPWCAVGIGNLMQAINALGIREQINLEFQPFELNPSMPVGGQDAIEHLTQKYGMDEAQVKANQANIRTRAKTAGYDFHPEGRKRVYNTFNCHRLLYWALLEIGAGAQYHLKHQLLKAYFEDASDMDEIDTLLNAVDRAGLNRVAAQEIIQGNRYVDEVKALEREYTQAGISAVPAVIFNNQLLISGAQSVESYQNAIEKILSDSAQSL
ncbi:DSBA oxidoreductase [Polynucleobacter sp. TUM22923]|jgi:predicted DsbA family dithiol-disulfide isomerase|uniref:DsbA family oxidoreductase n=1 Tax=Polynucleobacter sp. TUM22923 TaxID=3022126 RepID=UPI0025739E27|nr:DsbA family oxidoreductase [Polynucleobacter sp. TUM22923]BDX22039.1 DSBA oxidoreductase [Polynucleobacter sp. TUM22923]